MLTREKGGLKKMERYTTFLAQKAQPQRDVYPPALIYKFNTTPIKKNPFIVSKKPGRRLDSSFWKKEPRKNC